MPDKERVDLLIIGAGWHGLAMAKTFLEVTPTAKVILVDYAGSIGGTWAAERLYPGLTTNNTVGSFEFSDFAMDLSTYGLKPGQHIPGSVVHQYLVDFAEHYDLTSRIRLRTRVNDATLEEDGKWLVTYTTETSPNQAEKQQLSSQFLADKLVLATGLTSEPYMPIFPGQELFKGNILHSKQLKSRTADLEASRSVVVIGGNKSAWDVSYAAASRGAQVHLVMRPSGGGPSWVWRPITSGFGLFRTSISRLSTTRFMTWFDPYPFGRSGSIVREALHRSRLGRWLCSLLWHMLDRCVVRANGYERDARVGMMRPWTSTYWMGNSLSIHNYETDWFALVKEERIIPHIANVASLSETGVCLSDGLVLEADTIVTCTGWKSTPTVKFSPDWIDEDLRLAYWADPKRTLQAPGTPVGGSGLEAIREEILLQRPALRDPPVRRLPPRHYFAPSPKAEVGKIRATPLPQFRLYRFMVPASERLLHLQNLAVIGSHISIHAVMLAQAQALWITAFLQNRLASPPKTSQAVTYDTIRHSEYERIRRPSEAGGHGAKAPDLVFDSLPYLDVLLEDLGLSARRKASWLGDLFQPHTLGDYRGLVKEWLHLEELGAKR
ncbi:hypothetical protein F5Y15DRAFT_200786 [Xylariaceae sp. FL0016]|nr:hypothetical protein F5Y15DRAFT_200786 [Xylariaceae sp. FL0016]